MKATRRYSALVKILLIVTLALPLVGADCENSSITPLGDGNVAKCNTSSTDANLVQCTLSTDFDTMSVKNDLLPLVQGFGVDGDTILWIQAWGGGGGNGATALGGHTGKGGSGGYAQTVTTLNDIGSDTINYLIGGNGTHESDFTDSGGGGTSSIVFTGIPQNTNSFDFGVLVIAGGGGGGSYSDAFRDGQDGGIGGVIIATASEQVTPGNPGKGGGGVGQGGSTDGNGIGGTGQDMGQDGFGGIGGASQQLDQSNWLNLKTWTNSAFGGAGASSEGDSIYKGGGGGGGYGGGGSGFTHEDEDGTGGGGGGSLAVQPTQSDNNAPQNEDDVSLNSGDGMILFTFDLDPS